MIDRYSRRDQSRAIRCRAAAVLISGLALAWSSMTGVAAAADVVYYDLDPLVVDPAVPEDVVLLVQTDGLVDHADIDLAAGPILELASLPGDRFGITLTHDQVLFGYDASDVQHNFVGFLNTSLGGVPLGRRNIFINVADSAVPPVTVQVVAADMRATERIVEIHAPGQLPSEIDVAAVAQRFYQEYEDHYDFLNILSTPPHNANRHHITVRNPVSGIGLSLVDNTALYGSAGRLLGINRYPLPDFFDLGESNALHEIGHQWINFLAIPALEGGIPHWPVSSLAAFVMGFGRPGGQGLNFNFEFEALGNGDHRAVSLPLGRPIPYADLELYLMGLLPAAEVGAHVSFPHLDSVDLCDGCVVQGGVAVDVQDVIDEYGPRSPAHPAAVRYFSVATVVVSTLRPSSARELAFFDYFAARGEAHEPLPFTSGFARGTTLPFAVATGRRGILGTALGGIVFADGFESTDTSAWSASAP